MSRSSIDRAARFALMSADRSIVAASEPPAAPSFSSILGAAYGGEFRASDPSIVRSGNDVSLWPDMAGNGDLTAAGAARAVYDATGFNGGPCIKGNGTSSDMRATLSLPIATGTRPYHWVVCELVSTAGSRYPLNMLDAIPNGFGYLTVSFNGAIVGSDQGRNDGATLVVGPTLSTATRYLLEAGLTAGGTNALVVNGSGTNNGLYSGGVNGQLTRLALFSLFGSLFDNIKIAHYLYARSPSTQQIADVRAAFHDPLFGYGL